MGALRNLWTRAMLRGSSFTDSFRRLKMLYSIEDPWGMASTREQARFAATTAMLEGIAPRFDSILELGSGEGHQSLHLARITDDLQGVELSAQAVDRARIRCPEATFHAGEVADVPKLFADRRFELIVACEVLYYISDAPEALAMLQDRTDRLFVSNYKPRAEQMTGLFDGPGWRRLDDISAEGTIWECALWKRP